MTTLRLHTKGPDVERLQRALAALIYPVAIDGDFGPRTLDAVLAFQRSAGLTADGVVGPATWRALELAVPAEMPAPELPEIEIDDRGLLVGAPVVHELSHPSWYYARLATPGGVPVGVVEHYTATAFGTAPVMARRRTARFRVGVDRSASWHVTVAFDGRIWQQAPFTAGTWHVYGGRITVAGTTHEVNRACIGIEHEGHGTEWPEPMVLATMALHRAIVRRYGIPRARLCMYHSTFAGEAIRAGRIGREHGRGDPGSTWTRDVEPRVLAHALG